MSLSFRFEVRQCPEGVPARYQANAYLVDAALGRDIFLELSYGDSPAAAIEAAENLARGLLEELLGVAAKFPEVAR